MDASVNRIPSSKDERALLIALNLGARHIEDVEHSLDELHMLVSTAGGIVVDKIIMRRDTLDASHIIGKGQVDHVRGMIKEKDIRLVVFNLNSIRPAQVRTLEELLKCRVVGRSEVILDIFARRARSAEAKIQVELAQLNYILPRLKGLGGVLSRLGGGIGTRGPGEKMLETDRRHILKRISKLNHKLVKIARHRSLIRKSREGQVRCAVVGYTNAGKSTLINVLARDDLFVEDRLFATLDAYTRMVYLDETKKVLLTDTVGFISDLPAHLIESFKSTLEEIVNAHLLVHVVDATSRNIDGAVNTVNAELQQLGCNGKETIVFLNKCDMLNPESPQFERLGYRYPEAIIGSAVTGAGIDALKHRLSTFCETVTMNGYQDYPGNFRNNIHGEI